MNPAGCDVNSFKDFDCVEVKAEDAYAANCLVIGDEVIMPAGFKRVEENLKNIGFTPHPVNMSEFEKADGGITCLSLVLNADQTITPAVVAPEPSHSPPAPHNLFL